jgi:nitrate reductase NapAB chaperone NapD
LRQTVLLLEEHPHREVEVAQSLQVVMEVELRQVEVEGKLVVEVEVVDLVVKS